MSDTRERLSDAEMLEKLDQYCLDCIFGRDETPSRCKRCQIGRCVDELRQRIKEKPKEKCDKGYPGYDPVREQQMAIRSREVIEE